jgi:hypothetical protein
MFDMVLEFLSFRALIILGSVVEVFGCYAYGSPAGSAA